MGEAPRDFKIACVKRNNVCAYLCSCVFVFNRGYTRFFSWICVCVCVNMCVSSCARFSYKHLFIYHIYHKGEKEKNTSDETPGKYISR